MRKAVRGFLHRAIGKSETLSDAPTNTTVQSTGEDRTHGLMTRKFTLMNTITGDKLSKNMRQSIREQTNNIQPQEMSFAVGPNELPAQFDTRYVDRVPKDQVKYWFYRGVRSDGVEAWEPALTFPLDQGSCGSCWAFAAAGMFTDVICISLLKRYGASACLKSQFFIPIIACTGVSLADSSGVVNADSKVSAVEDSDGVSAYWTAGFSPKMREVCPAVGFEKCTHNECQQGLKIWQNAARGGVLADVHRALGSKFSTCMGCEGNHIAMPLIMYTDPNEGAASLISEFPVSEWACLFGTKEQQKIYCPSDYFKKTKDVKLPKIYRADKYLYATKEDLHYGYKPKGISTMEEWFRATIYNYGPIVIGFNVYDSFGKFFRRNPRGIYRHQDFLKDIKENPAANKTTQGGHAVVITGWDEVKDGDTIVKYWVVRNSWGTDWGDDGFFRIERNMDTMLSANGVPQRINFENEFGIVFFAPDPNPAIYHGGVANNPMTEFLLPPEKHLKQCRAFDSQVSQEVTLAKCSCPVDYVRIGEKCVRDEHGDLEGRLVAGVPFSSVAKYAGKIGTRASVIKAVLIVILLIILGFVIAARRHAVAASTTTSSVTLASPTTSSG